MRRERRSAKSVVTDYCNELLSRTTDKDVAIKLLTIETIAFRMGWNDIYDRLRYRKNPMPHLDKVEEVKHSPKSLIDRLKRYPDEPEDKPEPWWKR